MQVGLFIPCYIDQFFPNVGIASLELLTHFGCNVDYPEGQTCCGQPLSNSGFHFKTEGCMRNFVNQFESFDYIVAPSASCVLHLKEHLFLDDKKEACSHIRNNIFEITSFLTDVLQVKSILASFPKQVSIHHSCHGQRGLGLSTPSERLLPYHSKVRQLLQLIPDIQLFDPPIKDECCGFGGTFCVSEQAVSAQMGKETIENHLQNPIEIICSYDSSCLMHLDGIAQRDLVDVKFMHIAEILYQAILNKDVFVQNITH